LQQNSLSNGTGNFLTEQGIFAEEQGIQRNNSDDNRAADNERTFAIFDERNLVESIFKCRAAASKLCLLCEAQRKSYPHFEDYRF
jgi:hypothetical protein